MSPLSHASQYHWGTEMVQGLSPALKDAFGRRTKLTSAKSTSSNFTHAEPGSVMFSGMKEVQIQHQFNCVPPLRKLLVAPTTEYFCEGFVFLAVTARQIKLGDVVTRFYRSW